MIDFSKEEKEALAGKIKHWFKDELNQVIGQFDAEYLLDLFATELGKYFYNRGIYDAQAILESRMENLAEAITELENR